MAVPKHGRPQDRKAILGLGASSCKGMLLHTGTRKVKQPSAKQLREQGGEVHKVLRAENASDILTRPVSGWVGEGGQN